MSAAFPCEGRCRANVRRKSSPVAKNFVHSRFANRDAGEQCSPLQVAGCLLQIANADDRWSPLQVVGYLLQIADCGRPMVAPTLCVIPTEVTKPSGGISKNARSVFGGMYTPNSFRAKRYLWCIGVQRFCLDPATA